MKNQGFLKSLLLHIRYPWTAVVILIIWVGLATIVNFIQPTTGELMILIGVNGVATLVIALVGFK